LYILIQVSKYYDLIGIKTTHNTYFYFRFNVQIGYIIIYIFKTDLVGRINEK